MRHLISFLILTGALAHSGAALAEESTLPKTNAEQLKDACNKAGGKFSQDAKSIGVVPTARAAPAPIARSTARSTKCTAQVIGARRPHSVAEALTKPEPRRR